MAPARSRSQRELSSSNGSSIHARAPHSTPSHATQNDCFQASAPPAPPASASVGNQKKMKEYQPAAITTPCLPVSPPSSSKNNERVRSHHQHKQSHRNPRPPSPPVSQQFQFQSHSQPPPYNTAYSQPHQSGGNASTTLDSSYTFPTSSCGPAFASNRTTAGTTTNQNSSASHERKSSFSVATWMRDPLADVALDVLHKQTTVWHAFQQIVLRAPDTVAVCAHNAVNDEIEELTWLELHTQVLAMVKVLVHLGLGVGDGVVFCAKSSLALYVLHMATIAAGGVACHIRANWKSDELAREIFPNARAKILVLDSLSENFVRAIRDSPTAHSRSRRDTTESSNANSSSSRSHDLRAVVLLRGYSTERALSLNLPVSLLTMDDLRGVAHECASTDLPLLDRSTDAMMPSDCCVISFDYDPQGHVRGTCLSHDNVMFTAANLVRSVGPLTWSDRLVSYLPLHHVAAQVIELFMPLLCGVTVYCAPIYKREPLVRVIAAWKPTIFFATPDVWAHISTQVYRAKSHANSCLYRWAKTRATNNSQKLRFGHDAHRSLGYLLAKKLVLNAFKRKIGLESCSACYSVLAPLDFELEKLFKTIDIPIYQLYGVAQCSGFAAINFPHAWEFGTCGRALEGTVMEYDDPAQQLILRGRHVFLGYVKYHGQLIPSHTSDGWLRIEQQGHLTPDGFLKINDPPRNYLVLSTGDWVPTAPYERALSEQPELERAVLVGDGRPFLSVLLFMKTVKSQLQGTAAATGPGSSGGGGSHISALSSVRNSRGTSVSSSCGYQPSGGGGGTGLSRAAMLNRLGGSHAVLCDDAIQLGQSMGSHATTVGDVIKCQRWAVHFDRVLEQLPSRIGVSGVHVRKWVLMADAFSVDGGEIDLVTGEIKRRAVDVKYQALLDSMYR